MTPPARRAGLFGLFGSGEFLAWAGPVDRRLVEAAGLGSGAGPRVLVVPTASAPEGDEVFTRWGAMGLAHYQALGYQPEVVPLRTREDAEDPLVAATPAGASLIYFSGGNPAYLVRCLQGTAFWGAVEDAVAAGCSLGGSSAGIAFLGAATFDPGAAMAGRDIWVAGMGLFPAAVFGPHWDAVETWRPGATAMMLAATPPGCTFVGVDEDTALVGDGQAWEVMGRGAAIVHPAGGESFVATSGQRFALDLRPPGLSPGPAPGGR